MKKLYLYTVFHANLNFSSIPEDQYSTVLDRCYWPALDLLKEYRMNIGFEFSGSTLQTIKELDPDFITQLKKHWDSGRCEVIGSGYSQAILPLIPAKVNLANLLQGNRVYKENLGKTPVTAYVNEQTYSSGIIELYKEAGYENIIMDWDNATKYNDYPSSYRYHPQRVAGANNASLNLIWNSAIAFQKFQRYAQGLLSFDKYLAYIESHRSKEEDRSFLLYGNDLEIFDYRPGQADIHCKVNAQPEEFNRIRTLIEHLESKEGIEIITPAQTLKNLRPLHTVRIESPEYPIPCKKQDKYNATRWAVCGRENSKINTLTHRLYKSLKEIEFLNTLADKKEARDTLDILWHSLTYLWGSDFRTHTTDEKYTKFRNKLGAAIEKSRQIHKELLGQIQVNGDFALINPNDSIWDEPYEFRLEFSKGRFYEPPGIEVNGKKIPSQCEESEFYRDQSIRTAKIVIHPTLPEGSVSHGRAIEQPLRGDKRYDICTEKNLIRTPAAVLELNPGKGATIKKLIFPQIAKEYLIGELEHGYYDDITFSPDWHSGHITVHNREGRKFTDLKKARIDYPENKEMPLRIPIRCLIEMPLGKLWKTYYVYTRIPRVDIEYHFILHELYPHSFRLGITTINPECFNRETLKYSTVNGGKVAETFPLKNIQISQDSPVSLDVSTQHCLGATEDWLDISDEEKGITMITQKDKRYSVPLISYRDIKDSYFLRTYFTINERDNTTETLLKGHNRIKISYVGHKKQNLAKKEDLIFISATRK